MVFGLVSTTWGSTTKTRQRARLSSVSSFLLGIFLPSLLCFFQWSDCWQESQGLMQPSYFVHEHCLQRYTFPRLALFSKDKSTHCQNYMIHFINQPWNAVVFNNLSQKEREYIYVFLTCIVVVSEASFWICLIMFVSHFI